MALLKVIGKEKSFREFPSYVHGTVCAYHVRNTPQLHSSPVHSKSHEVAPCTCVSAHPQQQTTGAVSVEGQRELLPVQHRTGEGEPVHLHVAEAGKSGSTEGDS